MKRFSAQSQHFSAIVVTRDNDSIVTGWACGKLQCWLLSANLARLPPACLLAWAGLVFVVVVADRMSWSPYIHLLHIHYRCLSSLSHIHHMSLTWLAAVAAGVPNKLIADLPYSQITYSYALHIAIGFCIASDQMYAQVNALLSPKSLTLRVWTTICDLDLPLARDIVLFISKLVINQFRQFYAENFIQRFTSRLLCELHSLNRKQNYINIRFFLQID